MPALLLRSLRPKFVCPSCHAQIRDCERGFVCTNCALIFPINDGVPVFLTPDSAALIDETREVAENVKLRKSLSRSRLLITLADAFRPPHPFWYMRRRISRAQRRTFSQIAESNEKREDAVFLDIGSGILGGRNAAGLSKYITDHIVPIEIAPTTGIGVVGDAHFLPFADGSIDGVLIQGVLEHVHYPERIAREISRVLRPGAPVYAEVPFVQHFHLDPVDFHRWTRDGFGFLFREFRKVNCDVCAGPASALTDILTEFPALLFASPTLYWGTKVITGWIFSPLQFLDFFWAHTRRSHILAAALFFLGTKRQEETQ